MRLVSAAVVPLQAAAEEGRAKVGHRPNGVALPAVRRLAADPVARPPPREVGETGLLAAFGPRHHPNGRASGGLPADGAVIALPEAVRQAPAAAGAGQATARPHDRDK